MTPRTTAAVLLAATIHTAPLAGAAEPAAPAVRKIAAARESLDKRPTAAGWNALALALAARARETSDPSFYARAEEAVQQALALAPDDLEALKTRAWVLLGRHEFARARTLAEALNRRAPDDVLVYGLLTDANVELGDYAAAEKAAQWMLDLRPAAVAALTRGAYLRELFGDVPGALELMRQALERVPASETEERAWVLTQVAHLERQRGDRAAAEAALQQALESFPGYHYALGEQARLRTDQGRHAEAVDLLRERQRAADHPENLYELAEALQAAGRPAEARTAFATFEAAARREMDGPDNANRELIFYYAGHARRPAEALRISTREVAHRRDVHTLDAHAWALHVNGRHREAQRTMDEALAVGLREPRLLRHARAIARSRGDARAAARLDRELAALGAPAE
jgi:tetratricopeptide (TPR) repeat protein